METFPRRPQVAGHRGMGLEFRASRRGSEFGQGGVILVTPEMTVWAGLEPGVGRVGRVTEELRQAGGGKGSRCPADGAPELGEAAGRGAGLPPGSPNGRWTETGLPPPSLGAPLHL